MRKPFFLSLVVTCVTVAFAYGADKPATQPASTEPSPQTSLITHGALTTVIDGQAAFDPIDPFEVRLRFKAYAGELNITSIVPSGSTVKKGDVLLEIDPAAMKRTLAAAGNELLAAKASFDKATADAKVSEQVDAMNLRQQQANLKEAEDNVKWFETVDGPQSLKNVEMQVAMAKNQVNDEQDEIDQLKKMYKSEELTNATADIVVKRAVRQLEMSRVGFTMSEERADKNKKFIYPLSKQRVYDVLESAKYQFAYFQTTQQQTKVLRKTGMATVIAALDAATLKLQELKADAEKLTVRAPFAGVVGYGQVVNGVLSGGDLRAMRPGEHVTAQTVLLTLWHPGRLQLVLDLPEAKFFSIAPGQKASVSPVAFPEVKYEGMCDPHVAGGSSTGNYTLIVHTGSVDPRLLPGMKAQIHMDVTLADSVVLAPLTAVSNSTVSVKTPAGMVSRKIMTGRSGTKEVEILSGLRDGDEVLTQAKQ